MPSIRVESARWWKCCWARVPAVSAIRSNKIRYCCLPRKHTHTHSKNPSAHCLHRLNRCRALNAVLSFLPSKSSTHKIRAVCVGFRRFCRWTLRTLLLASDASTDTVAYKLDGFARDINQDTVNSWTVNTYQLHQSEWRISGIILSKPQPICP